MTIKQLIKEIKERGQKLPNGLESDVIIAHTVGEANININTAFVYIHDEKLFIVSSDYYYFVKYTIDGKLYETPPFLNGRDAMDWVEENKPKYFALWRSENGKDQLLSKFDEESI
jgi:hypothetical protein